MKTQRWSPGVGKEAQLRVKEKIYVKTSKNCTSQSTATVDLYLHSTSIICSCKIQISFMNILFWSTDSIARTQQNHLWAFIVLLQVRRGCFCSFIRERKVCLTSQSKNRTVITIKINKTDTRCSAPRFAGSLKGIYVFCFCCLKSRAKVMGGMISL